MRALLGNWRTYAGWAAIVPMLLFAAFETDPYVFGLSVLALGIPTGLLCIAAAFLVISRPAVGARSKLLTLVSLVVAVAAIISALVVLGAVRWA